MSSVTGFRLTKDLSWSDSILSSIEGYFISSLRSNSKRNEEVNFYIRSWGSLPTQHNIHDTSPNDNIISYLLNLEILSQYIDQLNMF